MVPLPRTSTILPFMNLPTRSFSGSLDFFGEFFGPGFQGSEVSDPVFEVCVVTFFEVLPFFIMFEFFIEEFFSVWV